MAFNREKYERFRANVLDVQNIFPSEHFHDGCMAVWVHDDIQSNPYPINTFEWYEWIDGYLDADLALNKVGSWLETAMVSMRK